MSKLSLSNPTIAVNNIPIEIVPNSFKFQPGYGETKVSAASVGGGITNTIHAENVETKIGKMTWEMYVTPDVQALVYEWKQLTAANAISAIQAGQPPAVMSGASMTNNPEFTASSDGKVSIEFMGDTMSANF